MSPRIMTPSEPAVPKPLTWRQRIVAGWRSQSELQRIVFVAGAIIIIVTIVHSGFFAVVPLQGSGIYVVNKYTGGVSYCVGAVCRDAVTK